MSHYKPARFVCASPAARRILWRIAEELGRLCDRHGLGGTNDFLAVGSADNATCAEVQRLFTNHPWLFEHLCQVAERRIARRDIPFQSLSGEDE